MSGGLGVQARERGVGFETRTVPRGLSQPRLWLLAVLLLGLATAWWMAWRAAPGPRVDEAAAATAPSPLRAKPLAPRPARGATQHPIPLPRGDLRQDLRAVLPHYRESFEEAARRAGLDWRLLAAVGYQESRWDPRARSPTGVRGLMMLTRDTALQLGVDREDARQSILGAGRLLQDIYAQLPRSIREPDRTAMVLAAYNQGYGHLLDARDVADLRGGNPDRWDDVRRALPLLEQAQWLPVTKYGFARGSEAVAFVERVRGYYAVLKQPGGKPA